MSSTHNQGFGTLCVHHAQEDFPQHSHMEPIYPTSTYSYSDAEYLMRMFEGKEKGHIYSRWSNPTFQYAAEKIAGLEAFQLTDKNGQPLKLHTMLFSSGMGAISALLLSVLKPGDKILTQGNLYGGTDEFIQKICKPLGIEAYLIDLHQLDQVETSLQRDRQIKLMYIETPANPTLSCYDIEKLSALAANYQVPTAVDNTFATPFLQQPFQYHVDFVIHSTTKYLNGHGNAIGGALVVKDESFFRGRLHEVMKLVGSNANPFDAWLLSNGLKTLELRMERHVSNALRLAEFFESHAKVSQVNYPGLASHPDYALCKKQMKKPGAMMSIELKGGLESGKKFISSLQLATLAVSLGTVDTIVQHPASMSHVKMHPEQRKQYGISDGLIRISVGIENIEDLLNDFDQALQAI